MFKQNENGRYNMVVMVNSNKHEIFLYNKCLTVNIQVQTNWEKEFIVVASEERRFIMKKCMEKVCCR